MEAVLCELFDRDEALKQLKCNLLKAQERMKLYADKNRKLQVFSVGEWAFLKLRSHRQNHRSLLLGE